MTKTHDRGRLDWLAELIGAAAPAMAAAYAAARVTPVSDWPVAAVTLVAGGGMFAAAFCAMRWVPAEPRLLGLTDFEPAAVPDDELLLDQPLAGAAAEPVAELLLDDALPASARDSRVVRLFADGRMPTAGQLRERIDRHLAESPAIGGDACDRLSEALAELRASLRQA